MSGRVIVYVDGFNLYHGIDDLGDNRLKWLGLWKLAEGLCQSGETLEKVYYFSAFATWKPDAYKRHRDYVKAIASKGVTKVMGQFKAKSASCHKCGAKWERHEEKETDVHIAVQIIYDACHKAYDRAILVTGDTDQAPTLKRARSLNPDAKISVWTPPNRNNGCRSLGQVKEIRRARLEQCLLPERVLAPDGSLIVECPQKYRSK